MVFDKSKMCVTMKAMIYLIDLVPVISISLIYIHHATKIVITFILGSVYKSLGFENGIV